MRRTTAIARALTVTGLLLLAPVAALAQSAISGVVKDTTGAVLPGVTVEAASPALIEKVRAVAANDRGLYTIVDLRPGTYTVTFTLPGFQTFKREGLELPSSFTATVNAEMKVGSLEESVTVSGSAPAVDVQTTANTQVLNREVLDAVPTGRTAQTAAALVPGVIMGTPDVAGSNGMSQNASQAHGYGASDATVLVDGVQLQGLCGNGSTQSYSNVQNYEEIVITNAGAGADVSGGGVRQNIIPKKGGNEFHGSGAAAYASGKWQPVATNADLIARGLVLGNKFEKIWNAETAFGGKFVKDKMWWYAGTRKNFANTLVADTRNADGTQGETPQSVKNLSLRVTNQLTPKHQLNVFYDRVWKEEIIMSAGYDPLAAEWTHPSPLYDQGQVKWTSPVSSRLFLEAGFNHYQPNRTNTYVPDCLCYNLPYESPGWFKYVTKRDTSLGTITGAYPFGLTTQNTTRHFYDASASYVTGSHNIKAGLQDQHGVERFFVDKNGDLEQVYQNGVPTSVSIFNSSLNYRNDMNHVWGVYAQDSWKMNRMTLSYGVRYEDVRTSIPAQEVGAGRFVAPRKYNGDKMPTYKSWNPRLGAVYDLLGDGKTAIKFSANKYEAPIYDTLTNGFNPIRSQSASITWNDLNKDDIALENEMNLAQIPANFGVVIPGCSVLATPGATPCGTSWIDPNRKR
ncbi:MAG: TonB-dependent receptor, partial [Acidobacteriota bacterium]